MMPGHSQPAAARDAAYPAVLPRTTPEGEFELTLGDVLGPLSRHGRLVLAAIGVSWLAILIGALALPSYRTEAALAAPDSIQAVKRDEPAPRGISIATYKALQKSLSDGAVLDAALGKTLSARQIGALRDDWATVLTPIAASGKNDITTADRGETITALAVTYSAGSAERARQVTEALGDLVREALVTTIAVDRVEARLIESGQTITRLGQQREELDGTNRSLGRLESELASLSHQLPTRETTTRELVDVRDGAQRFLPLPTQLIGVKAERANNDHAIRLAEISLSRQQLVQTFAKVLRDRFEQLRVQTGTFVIRDCPEAVRTELRAFLDHDARSHPEARFLRTWGEGLATELASYRTQMRFIEYPTVDREFRSKAAVALASLAIIVSMVGAYLVDAVTRRSPGRRSL